MKRFLLKITYFLPFLIITSCTTQQMSDINFLVVANGKEQNANGILPSKYQNLMKPIELGDSIIFVPRLTVFRTDLDEKGINLEIPASVGNDFKKSLKMYTSLELMQEVEENLPSMVVPDYLIKNGKPTTTNSYSGRQDDVVFYVGTNIQESDNYTVVKSTREVMSYVKRGMEQHNITLDNRIVVLLYSNDFKTEVISVPPPIVDNTIPDPTAPTPVPEVKVACNITTPSEGQIKNDLAKKIKISAREMKEFIITSNKVNMAECNLKVTAYVLTGSGLNKKDGSFSMYYKMNQGGNRFLANVQGRLNMLRK
jgi:hypothetical protein